MSSPRLPKMAAMQDMMTSDLELKSFMNVKLALPKESAETQYKPSTATQKTSMQTLQAWNYMQALEGNGGAWSPLALAAWCWPWCPFKVSD